MKPTDLRNTVIIANHYSNLDPFLVKKLFFRNKIVFVATKEVKKHLWSRIIVWAFETVFVDPDGINLSYIKQSIEVLKSGGTLCIFPEGYVNSRKYGFLDFKSSYLFVAKKAKASILPLFVYPSTKLFKKNYIKICEKISYDIYAKYTEPEDANMFFLAQIMEASSTINI